MQEVRVVCDARVAVLCVQRLASAFRAEAVCLGGFSEVSTKRRRVSGEPKLADEAGNDAEEARVVIKALPHEGLEPLHADRRPLRLQLDDHTLHVAVRERL